MTPQPIQIHAKEIYSFSSFQHWVNKASTNIGGYPKDQKIICIDINGNTLTNGGDFMIARDNGLFPVKAYRLVRTSEMIIK